MKITASCTLTTTYTNEFNIDDAVVACMSDVEKQQYVDSVINTWVKSQIENTNTKVDDIVYNIVK